MSCSMYWMGLGEWHFQKLKCKIGIKPILVWCCQKKIKRLLCLKKKPFKIKQQIIQSLFASNFDRYFFLCASLEMVDFSNDLRRYQEGIFFHTSIVTYIHFQKGETACQVVPWLCRKCRPRSSSSLDKASRSVEINNIMSLVVKCLNDRTAYLIPCSMFWTLPKILPEISISHNNIKGSCERTNYLSI